MGRLQCEISYIVDIDFLQADTALQEVILHLTILLGKYLHSRDDSALEPRVNWFYPEKVTQFSDKSQWFFFQECNIKMLSIKIQKKITQFYYKNCKIKYIYFKLQLLYKYKHFFMLILSIFKLDEVKQRLEEPCRVYTHQG